MNKYTYKTKKYYIFAKINNEANLIHGNQSFCCKVYVKISRKQL